MNTAKPSEENDLWKQLASEGSSRIYTWEDAPGAFYPDHTHNELTAHIILDGEMTLSMPGNSKTYRKGERCDVLAGAVHAAKMGPQGYRYMIGER